MALGRCPGQDKRNWKSQDVFDAPCPQCGKTIEFWKNEPRRRCTYCGSSVLNAQADLGCAKWCKYAKDCLGLTADGDPSDSLCQLLIQSMKQTFGDDPRRVRHALQVLDYAETILQGESADPLVVQAAAILHDIGIQQAERKHGSAAGKYQEIEGPPMAREILQSRRVDAARIDHICRIVGSHHSAGDIDTIEFRILWDADRLANAEEECRGMDRPAIEQHIEKAFRTPAGKALGRRLLLGEERPADKP